MSYVTRQARSRGRFGHRVLVMAQSLTFCIVSHRVFHQAWSNLSQTMFLFSFSNDGRGVHLLVLYMWSAVILFKQA